MPTNIRYLLAAILLAMVVVLPAAAQPSTPPATPEPTVIELKPASKTITLTVPADSTIEQKLALIKASTPENELVKIHMVIDENLKAAPATITTADNPVTSTLVPSYTLNWNRNKVNSYPSATPDDLSPTLSFNVLTDTVELTVFSYINFTDIETGDADHYIDFDYIRVKVTGSGVITIHLPTYKPWDGMEQTAIFDATLGEFNYPYGYLAEATIRFESHSRTYLPMAIQVAN